MLKSLRVYGNPFGSLFGWGIPNYFNYTQHRRY